MNDDGFLSGFPEVPNTRNTRSLASNFFTGLKNEA